MKYRLGLDVGTASVGLVALELDENNRPVKPVHQSVRIFDEPLLATRSGGVGEPKRASRRKARQQRRQHERPARRLKRLVHLARRMGLDPKNVPADNGQGIHELRARAATSKVGLDDLLRIFLKMGKRRGYYGGFKIEANSEKGLVETGINTLKRAMQERGCNTLGEYLWWRVQHGQHLRLKEDGLFANRQMVEDEFNRIWETQEQHHPVLKEDHSLQEHFYETLILQRPLKSPAAMVGNCSLEPMLPRAPMAQPIMQAFRIEKQIADLCWGASRRAQPLSAEQRDVIRTQLQGKAEVKFSTLHEALDKAGCPGPKGWNLNLSHGERETLTGDRTVAAMKSLHLLDEWRALEGTHQVSVINLLADMGSPEAFDIPEWDKQMTGSKGKSRTIRQEVKDFIDKMLGTGKFDRLSTMKFDGGRASYSIKALRKLVEVMREKDMDEYGAIDLAYPDVHKANTDSPRHENGSPLHAPTGNVVVDVALRQVRREVNAVMAQLGTPPSEIILELSRDMKAGRTRRDKMTKKMRDNENRRKLAAKEIETYTGGAATSSQIKRYLLWEEQGKHDCPYCDRPINLSDVLNGDKTDDEHILPQKLTRIGKNRKFLVLAHKACNQQKRDKTPWQAWGNTERWDIIERRAEQFKSGYETTVGQRKRTFKNKGKSRQLLTKDFDNVDDDVIGEFTDRQFQESAWIAKACGIWLRGICSNVSVSRGLLTAHLRRTWGLDTIISEVRYEEGLPVFDAEYQPNKREADQQECRISKEEFETFRACWEGHHVSTNRTHRRLNKRIDHRHHLVDAFVIALTTRRLYQRMATDYKRMTDSGEARPRLDVKPELENVREQVLEVVRHCRLSHRPDRWPAGKLFKDNPSNVKEHNGEQVYVQRKRLADLTETDRRNIIHDSTRTVIKEAFRQRLEDGVAPEHALQQPVSHPDTNTRIRRVRVRGYTASDAVRVEHGTRTPGLYKYLEPDGYAYLEFDTKDPRAKIRLVRLHEAMKPEKRRRASPNVVRLYKNDTVHDNKNDQYYVVQKFREQGPTVFLSPATEAIADIGKVKPPRSKSVSGDKIRQLSLVEDGLSSNSVG